jgi:hypothetical protein
MDDYEDIESAARHLDWQGCARIMFALLYGRTRDEQQEVAAKILDSYIDIWKSKHKGIWATIPQSLLVNGHSGKTPDFPEFPEELDLDPADAEFENGLAEFYNGVYVPSNHEDQTVHFATAIRSAVAARQIDRWIHRHPDAYKRWKAGRLIDGPTFLDDESATHEAQTAWEFVDRLFKMQHHGARPWSHTRNGAASKKVAALYRRWEELIL